MDNDTMFQLNAPYLLKTAPYLYYTSACTEQQIIFNFDSFEQMQ